ncbi:murein L,D-transpeptidase catalytic domain-containing protein [Hyphomonas sp.]|uniref:murein L,D-transpeptidase catalytic domain-containing protein n=1 Tax=Hyphomonas sp. TaxID=87 RepID=UPI00391917D8
MKTAGLLFTLFLLAFSIVSPAWANPLDPEGRIRPELLAAALQARDAAAPERTTADKLVIVDYSLHSSEERLFIVNLETGAVTAYRAAHGLGSDPDHDGYLDSFSSVPGSQASPEGLFRLAEAYHGQHGRSARMDGLEDSNRNARARAIVIHAAWYAEPGFLARHGKLGRSNGCIVFSAADLARFLDEVPEGALIFVGK